MNYTRIQFRFFGIVKAGYDYLANENVLDHVPIDFKKDDNNYYALKIKRRQYGNSFF